MSQVTIENRGEFLRKKAGRLEELIAKATDENLADDGRYFDDSLCDLTKCYHGDTGEYQNGHDGFLVEFLWNHRGLFLATLRRLADEVEASK